MIVDGCEIRQEFNTHVIGPHIDIFGYRNGKFSFHTSVDGSRMQSESEIHELLDALRECGVLKTA